MAGLYETWQPPVGPPVQSCTIVTTAANELVGEIHDRMPVIVPQDQQDLWLGAPMRIRNLLQASSCLTRRRNGREGPLRDSVRCDHHYSMTT